MVGAEQFLIMFCDMLRHAELHLGRHESAAGPGHGIDLSADMEDDVVIGWVMVMPVGEPVAGLVMDLHVAHPERPVDLHFGIEEIRSGMTVVQSGVDDLHDPVVGGREDGEGEELVLPAVVQQCFHGQGGLIYSLQK